MKDLVSVLWFITIQNLQHPKPIYGLIDRHDTPMAGVTTLKPDGVIGRGESINEWIQVVATLEVKKIAVPSIARHVPQCGEYADAMLVYNIGFI